MKLRTTILLIAGLIVVALALLLTTASPMRLGVSRPMVATVFVQQVSKTALATFKVQVGRFPSTAEGLEALLRCPPGAEGKWQGPYLDRAKVPLDPWGQPYLYRQPATKSSLPYDLWSHGPDRVPSSDDIGNWQVKP